MCQAGSEQTGAGGGVAAASAPPGDARQRKMGREWRWERESKQAEGGRQVRKS